MAAVGIHASHEQIPPSELLALVHGHQYLALTAATCAIAADLPDLKHDVERRYATVAEAQRSELVRLTS